jgi:hypothetical protein
VILKRIRGIKIKVPSTGVGKSNSGAAIAAMNGMYEYFMIKRTKNPKTNAKSQSML